MEIKHKILCGDLTKGDLKNLMGDEKADIVYSDPPWNDSWIKIFRERAGVVDEKEQNLEAFLKIYIQELKKYSKGIIYIEFGIHIDSLVKMLKEEGATQLNLWELPMGKGKFYIWRGYFHQGIYKKLLDLPKKDVYNWLVEQDKVEGGILLDPCIGIGRSYDLAKKSKMICYGLEIQSSKVNKLLSRIK